MDENLTDFYSIPGRLLLDTSILNLLQDEGEFIFEGYLPEGVNESDVPAELIALRHIFQGNQRASFQFLVSPLTFAELSNEKNLERSMRRVLWAFEMLNVWLEMLETTGDRISDGGTVRHRFKLSEDLQSLEKRLMDIEDFRQDPIDRLLLLQYKMGSCDAFLTLDERTIGSHRDQLSPLGFLILKPSQLLEIIKPWIAIWH